MKVYLDNAATTRVDEEVLRAMLPYFGGKFGNASSQHQVGQEAKQALDKSRKVISKAINSKSWEIVFTSGGTESNNFALKGLFFENYPERKKIITTKIEHDSILKVCEWLGKKGVEVIYLDVDSEGYVDLNQLERELDESVIVVSVIHANNEVGTIQDLEKIGKMCREKGVLFHVDACQSFTKVPLNVKKQNIDLMTLNAHKIHGPKGIGALYVRDGIKINSLIHGGGHENKLRSGTENIPGIVGFAESVKVASSKDVKRMENLRDKLIEGILEIKDTKLNGPRERLCNNVNISFMNIEGEAIGGYLEREGIFASTGSACMSNTLKSSHVLKAMKLSALESNSSLRISLSKYTTEEEIDYVLDKLNKVVIKLRRLSPLVN